VIDAAFRNPTFASDHLTMRPTHPDDAGALFEAYGDADLMTWWSSAPHTSLAQTRDDLARRQEPENRQGWRGWTMVASAGGAVVGTLGATTRRPGVAEIGYLVIRRHWSRSYAREGVSRLIDLLFVDEGHRRVMADTDPDNVASNGLLARLGFTIEGRLRDEWETHIGVRDSLIWGLLASEWRR